MHISLVSRSSDGKKGSIKTPRSIEELCVHPCALPSARGLLTYVDLFEPADDRSHPQWLVQCWHPYDQTTPEEREHLWLSLWDHRKRHWDVVIILEDFETVTFHVHRQVLERKSQWFQERFVAYPPLRKGGPYTIRQREVARDPTIFDAVIGHLYERKYTRDHGKKSLAWHVALYQAAHALQLPKLKDEIMEYISSWEKRGFWGLSRDAALGHFVVAALRTFVDREYDRDGRLLETMKEFALRNLDELRHRNSFIQMMETIHSPEIGPVGSVLRTAVEQRRNLETIHLTRCGTCVTALYRADQPACPQCGMPAARADTDAPQLQYTDGRSPQAVSHDGSDVYYLVRCPGSWCAHFMPKTMFGPDKWPNGKIRELKGACVRCGTYVDDWHLRTTWTYSETREQRSSMRETRDTVLQAWSSGQPITW